MSAEPALSNRQTGRFAKTIGKSKIDVQRGETLIFTDFKGLLLRTHRSELHRRCDYSRSHISFQVSTAFRSALLCKNKKERHACV